MKPIPKTVLIMTKILYDLACESGQGGLPHAFKYDNENKYD